MFNVKSIRERLYNNLMEADPEDDTADDEEFDLFSDEDLDTNKDGEEDNTDAESEDGEDLEAEEDTDEEDQNEVDTHETFTSDKDKVNKLYKDTGNPEYDYSLTNPNNVRLFSFKFKNAGIDPFSLMSESEQTEGLRSNELEARLTPDQLQVYKEKNRELRHEFNLLSEREKNIIIYNSNTPLLINDTNGNSVSIRHPADQRQAIEKLSNYMNRNFEDNWVDNKDAIEFLENIKVNFSEDPKIRPNLMNANNFEVDEEEYIIHFNKIYSEIPETVSSFIKENQDSEDYKKSSIFRTLVDDYVGSGLAGSRISVYPVIRNESLSNQENGAPEGDTEEDEEGEFEGGDFGGGIGEGGEDLGTEETPEEGEDTDEGGDEEL